MGEIKVASFRLDTETTEKFKEIMEHNGFTQAKAFDNLIKIFELHNAKLHLPDRHKEIEEFEQHAQRLAEIYLNALELNKNTEEYIRQEFSKQLHSKDSIVLELQEELTHAETSIRNLMDAQKQDAELIQSQTQQLQSLKEQNHTISQLVSEYRDKNDTLNGLLSEYKQYKEKIGELNKQLDDEKAIIKEAESRENGTKMALHTLAQKLEQARQAIEDLKQRHRQEIETLTDKAEIKRQKEILKLQQEYQEQINQTCQEYNDRVKSLLQELQPATKLTE